VLFPVWSTSTKYMIKGDLIGELARLLDKGELDGAKALVALGANVNAASKMTAGSTLLWLAVNNAGQEISSGWKKLSALLPEVLPDLKRRDCSRQREQHLRTLGLLLELKPDVNLPSNGSMPLRIAVHWQDLEVVNLLLSRGADPNAECFSIMSKLTRKDGRRLVPGYYNTVLHEAVEKNHAAIVKALLLAGADPHRPDHEGRTLLEIAHESGLLDVARLLSEE